MEIRNNGTRYQQPSQRQAQEYFAKRITQLPERLHLSMTQGVRIRRSIPPKLPLIPRIPNNNRCNPRSWGMCVHRAGIIRTSNGNVASLFAVEATVAGYLTSSPRNPHPLRPRNPASILSSPVLPPPLPLNVLELSLARKYTFETVATTASRINFPRSRYLSMPEPRSTAPAINV